MINEGSGMSGKQRKMRRIKKPLRLYHLSEENHDGKVFSPRIPLSALDLADEDQKTKRVCFSSSMSGACRAIDGGLYQYEYYVHVPVGLDEIVKNGKLYKPTEKEVSDCLDTGEYWILSKVKLKCIGIAKFTFLDNNFFRVTYSPDIRIRWIKKFE